MAKVIHLRCERDGEYAAVCSSRVKYNPDTVVEDPGQITCKRCIGMIPAHAVDDVEDDVAAAVDAEVTPAVVVDAAESFFAPVEPPVAAVPDVTWQVTAKAATEVSAPVVTRVKPVVKVPAAAEVKPVVKVAAPVAVIHLRVRRNGVCTVGCNPSISYSAETTARKIEKVTCKACLALLAKDGRKLINPFTDKPYVV